MYKCPSVQWYAKDNVGRYSGQSGCATGLGGCVLSNELRRGSLSVVGRFGPVSGARRSKLESHVRQAPDLIANLPPHGGSVMMDRQKPVVAELAWTRCRYCTPSGRLSSPWWQQLLRKCGKRHREKAWSVFSPSFLVCGNRQAFLIVVNQAVPWPASNNKRRQANDAMRSGRARIFCSSNDGTTLGLISMRSGGD